MQIINYKLLSKQENDRGITLTFEKTLEEMVEGWVDKEPQTFLESLGAFFGVRCGHVSYNTETNISEFTVFYPKSEHGTVRTTDMCYPDGGRVPFELQQQLLRLVEMASFKEKPVTQFEAK